MRIKSLPSLSKILLLLSIVIGVACMAHAQSVALMEQALQQDAGSTQPASAASAPASKSTGNANGQPSNSDQPQTLAQVLAKTRLGKLAQGEQVSLNDMRDPAFWIDTIRDLIIALVGFIPRLIVAMLFLLVFWVIYRAIRRLFVGSMKKAHVDPSIREMLGHLIKWTIMGFGVVIACNQIGIQIAALLTGVSIIGLAIGFAAQETLANFIAGVVIFWDKPFRVGDWIEIDSVFGQVQRVTFRSTRLLSLDGDAVVFPNTQMLANKLANHTTHPLTRVSVSIGIAYKESIDKARMVLLNLMHGDQRVESEPAPTVVVDECGASSVNLLLRFWIRDESQAHRLRYEYLERAKNALDREGVSIPFPHVQLLLEETSAVEKLAGGSLRKAG